MLRKRIGLMALPGVIESVIAPGVSSACPYCNSPVAERVRSEVFGADFLPNFALLAMPIIVSVTLASAIVVATRRSPRRKASQGKPPWA